MHDKRWRDHWLRCLNHMLVVGELTPIQHTVGVVLADHSNQAGEHVYPGHRRLGAVVQRSRSTVRVALARLRELGLLEWEHRFRGPGPDGSHPRGTSNLYEFLLPAGVLAELGLRQPRPPRHNHGRTTPPVDRNSDRRAQAESAAAAEAMVATTFDEARERLEATFDTHPEIALYAVDALTRHWAEHRPPG